MTNVCMVLQTGLSALEHRRGKRVCGALVPVFLITYKRRQPSRELVRFDEASVQVEKTPTYSTIWEWLTWSILLGPREVSVQNNQATYGARRNDSDLLTGGNIGSVSGCRIEPKSKELECDEVIQSIGNTKTCERSVQRVVGFNCRT